MPRYFFNVDGAPNPVDEDGIDLKGPEQARDAAVTLAGEMLQDADGRFWGGPAWRLNVIDETGATVCRLTITGET
ncbi:DUF6894 family protein [Rubellimicrobium arenae]|uniref:DUF6894 family protein n=1 Tax=Rubellimicrobium arenae TaxID=2817372 RepID=UPI001B3123CC|nr:hypothetical protein [Rubellimicrobium arenae]